jgi:macrolide-specific efflux system membrane fusion protein
LAFRVARKRLVFGAALILLAAAGLGLVFGRDAGGGPAAPTQTVVLGDIEDTVSAVGTLQPQQFVDVGTQVSGQLKQLFVTYGDHVKQGQWLAQIDPTVYQARVAADEAQLQNLRAQLEQRRAQFILAQDQMKRQTALKAGNATSDDALQTARANERVAAAQVLQLEAQIKQAESTLNADQANLGYTKIYAPMDGTVVDLIAKQGQTLNANQQAPIVLRIANLDTMTVWAQVSEADLPRLRLGMKAYFTTLGQSNRRRFGTLRQIIPTPQLVNGVVLYNCLFDVENPGHELLPQMTAQVSFIVAQAEQVPIVPVAAIRRERGGTGAASVDVIVNGKTERRTVEVGATDRIVVEIKSGLAVGDVVLLNVARPSARAAANPGAQRGPGGPMGGMPRL